MSNGDLRILHLSDLHARAARDGKRAWKRAQVLGDPWLHNLDDITADGRGVDLVVLTGDIADWGRAEEYGAASELIAATLARLGVPMSCFYVVPGNHDVDRSIAEPAWKLLRRGIQAQPLGVSEWLAGAARAPFGCTAELADEVLGRQQAFWQWVARDLGRDDLLPARSPHGRLGYRTSLQPAGLSTPVHIIGLDSSWLAGDTSDAGQLWLTDDQLGLLCLHADGTSLPGFRLALVHHPLGDLADQTMARRLLADSVDLLLRGHQHTPLVLTQHEPGRTVRELAAGCLYEGHLSNRYPNTVQVIDARLGPDGRPHGYRIRFRSWSPNGHWHDNSGLYRDAPDGWLSWAVDAPQAMATAAGQPTAAAAAAAGQPTAAAAAAAVSEMDLRRRLEATFSAGELELLVADAFPEVHGGLDSMVSAVHPLQYRIHHLIMYCARRGWLARLAAAIAQARPS